MMSQSLSDRLALGAGSKLKLARDDIGSYFGRARVQFGWLGVIRRQGGEIASRGLESAECRPVTSDRPRELPRTRPGPGPARAPTLGPHPRRTPAPDGHQLLARPG